MGGYTTSVCNKPTRLTQPCIPLGSLNRVPALTVWGKGGNVTSAGWQIMLCDPIWHVSSRSSKAFANCYMRLLTYLLLVMAQLYEPHAAVERRRHQDDLVVRAASVESLVVAVLLGTAERRRHRHRLVLMLLMMLACTRHSDVIKGRRFRGQTFSVPRVCRRVQCII